MTLDGSPWSCRLLRSPGVRAWRPVQGHLGFGAARDVALPRRLRRAWPWRFSRYGVLDGFRRQPLQRVYSGQVRHHQVSVGLGADRARAPASGSGGGVGHRVAASRGKHRGRRFVEPRPHRVRPSQEGRGGVGGPQVWGLGWPCGQGEALPPAPLGLEAEEGGA